MRKDEVTNHISCLCPCRFDFKCYFYYVCIYCVYFYNVRNYESRQDQFSSTSSRNTELFTHPENLVCHHWVRLQVHISDRTQQRCLMGNSWTQLWITWLTDNWKMSKTLINVCPKKSELLKKTQSKVWSRRSQLSVERLQALDVLHLSWIASWFFASTLIQSALCYL